MSTQIGPKATIANQIEDWVRFECGVNGHDPGTWKSKPSSASQWDEACALAEAFRRQSEALDFAKSPAFKGYLSKPPGREWSENFLQERAPEIAFLQRPVAKTDVLASFASLVNIVNRARRDVRAMMDGTLHLKEAIVDRFEGESHTTPSFAFTEILQSRPCAAFLLELGKDGDRYTLDLSEKERDPKIRETVSAVLGEVTMVRRLRLQSAELEAEEARRHNLAVGTKVIENMKIQNMKQEPKSNNRHNEPPTQNRNAPPRFPSP